MADRAKTADPQRWWSKDTVAVVTGGNKGIGFEIARQLANEDVTVVLTARDEKRGQEAVKALKEENISNSVIFHQLDVTDPKSIASLATWIRTHFGGLDILVNNAGLLFSALPDKVQAAKEVIDTNYHGVKNLNLALLPLFRPSAAGARIVNVSSMAGMLFAVGNEKFQAQLRDVENLTEETIESFVDAYIKDRGEGANDVLRMPFQEILDNYGNYVASKAACNAHTRVLARKTASRKEGEKVYVNCMCPGVTNTDMSSGRGHSAAEGAETAVWLALRAPADCQSGKFFIQKQVRSFDFVEEARDKAIQPKILQSNTDE